METACPFDALVVLGCRVGPQGQPSGALRRRLLHAAEGYHQGKAPLLLACGGRRWQGHPEAWVMREQLIRQGVPEGALMVELWSFNTLENAHYAAGLLRPRGLFRVGLVTCDWHMTRALALFRRAGLQPSPLPARSPSRGHRRVVRAVREGLSGLLDALP